MTFKPTKEEVDTYNESTHRKINKYDFGEMIKYENGLFSYHAEKPWSFWEEKEYRYFYFYPDDFSDEILIPLWEKELVDIWFTVEENIFEMNDYIYAIDDKLNWPIDLIIKDIPVSNLREIELYSNWIETLL